MTDWDAAPYDTDKSQKYMSNYQRVLGPLSGQELRLLELGVHRGGSLLMWRDLLPRAVVAGLDVKPIEVFDDSGRVHSYQGYQQDISRLDQIAAEVAPHGFDVIIDDASHLGAYTKVSFWHLFRNHLKPGGIFVIEDWGTGYWDRWPDGRAFRGDWVFWSPSRSSGFAKVVRETLSNEALAAHPRLQSLAARAYERLLRLGRSSRMPSHDAGMVGFVKQLVDACAIDTITRPDLGVGDFRQSEIARMEFQSGQVFVFKAVAEA